MNHKYVAYIRVNNKSDYAVNLQKNWIDNYVKKKNIKIDHYYIDDGYSGINFDRPQFKQLLKDVENRKITKAVIVKDLSRLSRNMEDIYEIEKRVSKQNVELISICDNEILDSNILEHIVNFNTDLKIETIQ
jgi:site-specific DNA recombinase